jgi:D-alanyl-D-alanine carboxypeptidase/D-alanyl-D-alanine-endopeptidase (penicillin-binding protein 4)
VRVPGHRQYYTLVAVPVRWVLCALLVVGAVVVGAIARLDASGDAVASDAASAATPVWSPRRLPGPFVDPLNDDHERAAALEYQHALDADVARYGNACFVVERGSIVLASHNADVPLLPASTQKLLTAAAALTTLGPDFRFETSVEATSDGPNLDRLWFVGVGDPVIRTAQYMDEGVSTSLESLADAIVAKGIRRIGTVVGDDSRYDSVRFLPTWNASYRTDFDIMPVGALEVTQSVAFVNGKPVAADDPAIFAASELTRFAACSRRRGGGADPRRGTRRRDARRVGHVAAAPHDHPLDAAHERQHDGRDAHEGARHADARRGHDGGGGRRGAGRPA